RQVAEEDAVVDRRCRRARQVQPGVVLDGPADPEVPRAAAQRPVVDEGAVGHGQGGAAEVVDTAADAATEEGAAATPQRLVRAEGAGDDSGTTLVEQPAAEDVDRVGGSGRGITGQDIPTESQAGPDFVEDAAPAQ